MANIVGFIDISATRRISLSQSSSLARHRAHAGGLDGESAEACVVFNYHSEPTYFNNLLLYLKWLFLCCFTFSIAVRVHSMAINTISENSQPPPLSSSGFIIRLCARTGRVFHKSPFLIQWQNLQCNGWTPKSILLPSCGGHSRVPTRTS